MSRTPRTLQIRHQLRPGDLQAVVRLRGLIYAREFDLDTTLEPEVSRPLADLVLAGSGRLWIAESEDRIVGSIALFDAGTDSGELRWFLVVPEARGAGLGRRLLEAALAHAHQRGLSRVFLWSLVELTQARALYERAGFTITETTTSFVWGAERTQVRMDLELPARIDARDAAGRG